MNGTKLPDRLHDLASQMTVDLERSAPRTLRRARVRRGATALLSSAVVIAVVLGGVAIVRVAAPEADGSNREVPATQGPSPGEFVQPLPAPFLGLWPETTPEALAEAQAQVDDGHQPWRLDPVMTAQAMTAGLFGWAPEDFIADRQIEETTATLQVYHLKLPDPVPWIRVDLAQLGLTGPNGIWSVTAVSSPAFQDLDLQVAPQGDLANVTFRTQISAELLELPSDFEVLVEVLGGPDSTELVFEASLAGPPFEGEWVNLAAQVRTSIVWVHVVERTSPNVTLVAQTLRVGSTGPPIPEPTGVAEPSVPDFANLPPDVGVAAQMIYDAALDHDLDALAELIDPTTFVYNFDDALDPLELWRADPTLLDAIPQILSLPPYVEEVQADRPYYVWPYLMEAGALDEIADQERADLHALGFSDEHIEEMQAFGGYLGPRLTIAADGIWLNYVTGGD